jgi:predicted secreted protein
VREKELKQKRFHWRCDLRRERVEISDIKLKELEKNGNEFWNAQKEIGNEIESIEEL